MEEKAINPRLPVSLVGAALVAFAGLYLVGPRFVGLPILGALLAGTYFTRWRLPGHLLVPWAARTGLFLLVLMIAPERRPSGISLILEPDYIHAAGYLLAAELVLRAWMPGRSRTSDRVSTTRLGEILLLATLVLTTATNTYDPTHLRWAAPAFAGCVAIALRQFRPRGEGKRRPVAIGGAIVVVLVIGGAATVLVAKYEAEISRLFVNKLISARRGSSIGMSARMPTMGSVHNPYPSDERVLVVEGSLPDPHLRAVAFDTYGDATWGPGVEGRVFSPVVEGAGGHQAAERVVTVTRYVGEPNLVYVPLETVAVVRGDEGGVEREGLGTVRPAGDAGGTLICSLTVTNTGEGNGGLFPTPTAEEKGRLLAVPEKLDPRVKELAVSVGGADRGLRAVQGIVRHLQANHAYSLSYNPGEGEPVTNFLLSKAGAHCQYFAAGAVILARLNGLPARCVTGLYAHEMTGGNTLTVRQRDAHAWAEVYLDGRGWVTVDATPAGGRPEKLFQTTPWYRRAWERVTDAFGAVKGWLADRTLSQAVIMIAGMAAVPLVIRLIKARRMRVREAAGRGYDAPAELAVVVGRFARLIKRRGLAPPAYATWGEHLPEGFAAFVEAYNALRFGGERVSEEEVARLAGMVAELEKTADKTAV